MGGGKKWEAEGEDVVCEKGKKNYGQKKFYQKSLWSQNIFGFKEMLVEKNIWSRKMFWLGNKYDFH